MLLCLISGYLSAQFQFPFSKKSGNSTYLLLPLLILPLTLGVRQCHTPIDIGQDLSVAQLNSIIPSQVQAVPWPLGVVEEVRSWLWGQMVKS